MEQMAKINQRREKEIIKLGKEIENLEQKREKEQMKHVYNSEQQEIRDTLKGMSIKD